MANNRLYLVNKKTGRHYLIAEYYYYFWQIGLNEATLEEFIAEHKVEDEDLDLGGNPWILEYETTEEEAESRIEQEMSIAISQHKDEHDGREVYNVNIDYDLYNKFYDPSVNFPSKLNCEISYETWEICRKKLRDVYKDILEIANKELGHE